MQKHGPNTSDPLGSGRRCGACINTLSVSRRETCLPQAFLHDNDEANRRGGTTFGYFLRFYYFFAEYFFRNHIYMLLKIVSQYKRQSKH